MRTELRLFAVAALAASVVACEKKESSGGPAASASAPLASAAPSASSAGAPSATASGAPSARLDGGRGRGVAAMFVRAAGLLPDLTEAQKAALAKLDEGLAPTDLDTLRAENKAIHDELVAGIKAGKIDAAKMTAHYAAFDKAAQARIDREAEALNSLYAVLEPAQRRGLVAVVRAKQAAQEKEASKRMPDGGGVDWAKRRLDGMTKDLGLDDAQQKAVAALMAKMPSRDAARDAEKQRLGELLAAFERDGFDAKKLDLGVAPGKKPHDMITQNVDFTTALVALLKPDQRNRLAAGADKQRMSGWGGQGGRDDD